MGPAAGLASPETTLNSSQDVEELTTTLHGFGSGINGDTVCLTVDLSDENSLNLPRKVFDAEGLPTSWVDT